MQKHKFINVKLDAEVYQLIADISAVTGVSIRALVANALDQNVKARLGKDDRLKRAVATMQECRQGDAASS